MDDFKYDVAISFVVQDVSIATALNDKLCESLRVFFFPRNQEELAGTDGLESMRKPFFEESRLNVVIYRERWGNTPWTGVEAAAIRDSCLNCEFRNVFFFMVEPKDKKPKWLPDTPVRFNYGEFTLEQAIGAIKARVQERGGHFESLTPLKRAEQLRAEEKYQRARSRMSSDEGLQQIQEEVAILVRRVENQVGELRSHGHAGLECEANPSEHVILRYQRVGMIIRWSQRWSNSLEDSGLFVEEYNSRLLFNSELGQQMYIKRPEIIQTHHFNPDVSRGFAYGWKAAKGANDFIPTESLADFCLIKFIDLIERDIKGQIKREPFY
jgi:hypothetical protein